jgi:hypothetical protein
MPALRTKLVQGLLLPVALALLAVAGSGRAAQPAKSPITAEAEEALWWGDFAALERRYAYFNQPGRFEPDGFSQLHLYRKGFRTVFKNNVDNAEAYLKEVDILTLQWANENPKSALAHILHANALVEHGWSYRGGGYANEVPPEAWKDFRAYLRRAADYLKDHADVALTDSYAHRVLLQIGRGLSWDDAQMAAIAREGLARNPDDLVLYFDMMGNLLPKWGGNAKVLDDYINYVAAETRAQFGLGMYARLYSDAAEDQYGHALFEDSHADWAKMKQGYDDLYARYPNSPSARNRYAYMACLAKDKTTLLKLLGELGSKIETSEWGPNPERSLEGCRRWAAQL